MDIIENEVYVCCADPNIMLCHRLTKKVKVQLTTLELSEKSRWEKSLKSQNECFNFDQIQKLNIILVILIRLLRSSRQKRCNGDGDREGQCFPLHFSQGHIF